MTCLHLSDQATPSSASYVHLPQKEKRHQDNCFAQRYFVQIAETLNGKKAQFHSCSGVKKCREG